MKLALLLPRSSGSAKKFPSGGDLYDAQLASALKRRGHEVDVFRTPQRLDASAWAARLRKANYDAVLQDELGHADYLRLNRQLSRAATDANRRRRERLQAIAIVHVTRARLDPNANSGALERQYLESVDAALFVSRQVKRETERLLRVRVKAAVAHPGSDHFPRRRKLQRNAAVPVRFVCAGHLLPNKGQLELVEACAGVRGSFTLKLAGDATRDKRYGAQVKRAVAKLGDRVELLGPLTAAGLAAVYQRADIFVSASFYESYGIAAAEALRAGLPVVAWSEGGLWEFLTNNGNALRVKPRDRKGLASAMTALCEDERLRARLERNARRTSAALPTWDDAAIELEKLLRR